MVNKKYKCDMCKRIQRKHNLINVNGYGLLCTKCRFKTEAYKINFRLPFKKTLLEYFGIKNKKKGEITKK